MGADMKARASLDVDQETLGMLLGHLRGATVGFAVHGYNKSAKRHRIGEVEIVEVEHGRVRVAFVDSDLAFTFGLDEISEVTVLNVKTSKREESECND